MFNKKIKISENKRTIIAVAVTFLSVFGIKAGLGSLAKEQLLYNPSVSTVSTNVVTQVEPYSEPAVYVEDDTLFEGESVIVRQGKEGFVEEIIEVTSDGDKTNIVKVLETNVIKEAVASEIHVGTKVKPDYIYPLTDFYCSYGVGYREDGYHKGMDLICPCDTRVEATADGVVSFAGWMDGYGYCVFIDHGDGIESRCAHMNEALVQEGEKVKQGQQIGWSGNTGWSECPHVHFEIRRNGEPLNPVTEGLLEDPGIMF